MYTSFLAGSIVALSVGRTVAAGMAWAGVNIAGFDFGCEITVRSDTPGGPLRTSIDDYCRERAIFPRLSLRYLSIMVRTVLVK